MENTAAVKAVVMDLDRTLLRSDKTISSYTAQVLEECRKHSIQIMAATARPLRTAVSYCRVVNFDAMVVSNGARILHGDYRREYGICRESAQRLLNGLARHPGLRITLETGDCAYANKPIGDYETVLSENLADIAGVEGALKILVHLDEPETLALVQRELTQELYCTTANGYLLQIMSKAATKWNGIRTLLDRCGCAPEETVYFGDDYDDIEPIRKCGIGVAVANGIDEVRAAADHVAESNDADGVAKFLARRILQKL